MLRRFCCKKEKKKGRLSVLVLSHPIHIVIPVRSGQKRGISKAAKAQPDRYRQQVKNSQPNAPDTHSPFVQPIVIIVISSTLPPHLQPTVSSIQARQTRRAIIVTRNHNTRIQPIATRRRPIITSTRAEFLATGQALIAEA